MADQETWQERERRQSAAADALLAKSKSNLVNALSEFGIQKNPAATNYLVNLMGGSRADYLNKNLGTVTNLPNTLTILGHGTSALSKNHPEYNWKGIVEDDDLLGKLPTIIKEKRMAEGAAKVDAAMTGRPIPPQSGGLALADIAQSLGNETNNIKRIVLAACFRAGYTPQEIRSHFPNADEIIASNPDQPTSMVTFDELFKDKETPHSQFETNGFSPFFNFQRNQTNQIKSAGDWLNLEPKLPQPPQRID